MTNNIDEQKEKYSDIQGQGQANILGANLTFWFKLYLNIFEVKTLRILCKHFGLGIRVAEDTFSKLEEGSARSDLVLTKE